MKEWLRRAFTRKIVVEDRHSKTRTRLEPPSDRLVLTVQFSIYLLLALVALEIAHLAVLHTWNSEIFAAITGLAGTIFGVLLEKKV